MIGRDVIVIGGSAGSMKPLGRLASSLPANLEAAVFLMPHYTLPKFLYGILRDWKLRVRNAVDLERVDPGNLYICPADHNVSLENGVMRVERSPRESVSRPSINALFRSAVITYGRRVVGVVMSGLLADGYLWAVAHQETRRVTMVQDPASAEFRSIPQSALNDVAIDFVLSVEGIAQKLIELAPGHPGFVYSRPWRKGPDRRRREHCRRQFGGRTSRARIYSERNPKVRRVRISTSEPNLFGQRRWCSIATV